ncbi:hypothetical protein MUN89_18045 [Halobacillus salinarum]|uniref:Lipoprotein n=1 Tax=Halobacillus salinarum TaxID=2932257 RepID=A0ABY4EH13_9BACI|nr:hypothetical protein [Halobacillus salinarum]UOQ43763.1 hypothetical protein MUN89_18045 [Halobacillus salinarum]
MKRYFILFITVVLMAGCFNAKEVGSVKGKGNEGVRPFMVTDKSNGVYYISKFVGVPHRFGMINVPTTTNDSVPIYLYFWGNEEEYTGKDVKIKLEHLASEKEIVLEKTIKALKNGKIETPPSEKSGVIKLNGTSGIAEKPVGFITSKVEFPNVGTWKLKISKNKRLLGSMNIEVTENDTGLERLNKN